MPTIIRDKLTAQLNTDLTSIESMVMDNGSFQQQL